MPETKLDLITSDGLKLQGRCWKPKTPKAAVLLIHGLGEHCGRYEYVAETFNQAGFALEVFDLRGHGKSEGKRGHVPNYEILLDDISRCLNKTKELFPNLPTFLYGHSLGGNLAIHYALKKRTDLTGVIATAPLLRLAYTPPAWQQNLLKVFRRTGINITIPSGLDDTALSRDAEVVDAYRNDPLIHDRITPSLAVGMIEAGEWNLEHANELPCPLLLIHGDADRITSHKASEEFAASAGKNSTLKIWEGLYHEALNEPEKEDVLADILNWLSRYS